VIFTRAALPATLRRRRGRFLVVTSTAAGTADACFIERIRCSNNVGLPAMLRRRRGRFLGFSTEVCLPTALPRSSALFLSIVTM